MKHIDTSLADVVVDVEELKSLERNVTKAVLCLNAMLFKVYTRRYHPKARFCASIAY